MSPLERDDRLVTKRRLEILQGEILRYQHANNRLPESLKEILDLPYTDPNLRPQQRWLMDAWGQAIIYRQEREGRAYELRSIGPDGRLGTEDDIVLRQAPT